MKKAFLFFLIITAIFLGYSFRGNINLQNDPDGLQNEATSLVRVALVADSHNENELLAKALEQAKGMGINFVIGLGDYTNLGTVEELRQAREVFENSKLEYYLTAGDRDGWESRGKGSDNFGEVFGKSSQIIERNGVQFVLLDNSNLYSGISNQDWRLLEETVRQRAKGDKDSNDSVSSGSSVTLPLVFVFAHKTPFHPDSSHVMGEDSAAVAEQAKELLGILEGRGSRESQGSRGKAVDGFFSGDLHFFARYQSPSKIVKMTTVGAVASERNFQGPRFSVLTVYDDYSWEVEDVEIR